MNTSPEAKQAAERLLNCAAYSHLRRSEKEVAYVAEHFQQAMDAATAKLREENTNLKIRIVDLNAEVEHWIKKQLAHQPLDSARDKQPSASPAQRRKPNGSNISRRS